MTLTTDNRDLQEMEKFYLARIETLEKELEALRKEYDEEVISHGIAEKELKDKLSQLQVTRNDRPF